METRDSLESRWRLVTLLFDLCKSEQWRANTRFRVHTRLDSSFHCSFVRLLILTIGIVKDSYIAPGPSRKRTAQGEYKSKSYNQQNTSAHPH